MKGFSLVTRVSLLVAFASIVNGGLHVVLQDNTRAELAKHLIQQSKTLRVFIDE